jgi:hypothetical protein
MAKKRSVHREQVKAVMACEKKSPNSLLYFTRGVLHALQLIESVDLGSEGGSARERNASFPHSRAGKVAENKMFPHTQ